MREIAEFRVSEGFAHLLFRDDEGVRLGDNSIRKITISTSDPRYAKIGELQRQLRREHDKVFFFGWSISRRYTKEELGSAEYFTVWWTSTFEPAGEQSGTVYDETLGCPHVFSPQTVGEVSDHQVTSGPYTCGVGATRVTPLMLDRRRIPKTKDFARTIAEEDILSERARMILEHVGLAGGAFEPVRFKGSRTGLSPWFELVSTAPALEIVAPTRAGIDPFDHDDEGKYRCPHGHVLGLNLLSELSVRRPGGEPADVYRTRQCIGARVGVLRPRSLLVVSAKVRHAVLDLGLKGWQFEVAHFA